MSNTESFSYRNPPPPPPPPKIKRKQFKIAYCPCGDKVVISSLMPYAETDEDSQKTFRELCLKGRRIEIVESIDVDKFDRCYKCNPEQLSFSY